MRGPFPAPFAGPSSKLQAGILSLPPRTGDNRAAVEKASIVTPWQKPTADRAHVKRVKAESPA